MEMMISKTNIAIQETRVRLPAATLNFNKNPYFCDTNEIKIRGLLGMMYYRAMINQSLESVDHLFNEELGPAPFGSAMSSHRFRFMLTHLSVDDKTTRGERWKSDRFAAMRGFFELFNMNCSSHLVPREHHSINETLYPSR